MELLVLLLPLRHVVQLVVYLMDALGDVFQLGVGPVGLLASGELAVDARDGFQ
ncbi:MAG: hypothetical protein MK191_06945 [Acidimicrobiales bacterium]|nr:hypothetical protein [Acidimicrobiales bacterium]